MREFNILIDELPDYIIVDDEEYTINSDFSTFILFELLINDNTVSNRQKLAIMMDMLFPKEKPPFCDDTVDAIIEFYRCSRPQSQVKANGRARSLNSSRVYDFDYDAEYIYSAFMEQYHIDLNSVEHMHWWKFKALFNSLNHNCEFVKIMSFRSADTSQIKDEKEKARIEKMKAIYALPNQMSGQDKALRIGAILGGGMR